MNSSAAILLLFLSSFYVALVQGITQTSPNLVINPTCSLPFSTGWSGAADWECEGPYIFPGAESSSSEAWQYVDVTPYQQFIAAGNVNLVFSVNVWTDGDEASLYITFLDSGKNYITNWYLNDIVSLGEWSTETLQGVIPTNTHYVLIQLVCDYLSGSGYCYVWFEQVSLTLSYSVPASGLVYGLHGARGSSYLQSSNLLYFVESSLGALSSFSVIRNLQSVVFNASRTIGENQALDLVLGTSNQGGDIILDLYNYNTESYSGPLNLRPQGNCNFNLLGYVPFAGLTQASLQNLIYAYEYIPFSLLQPNFVFAVYNDYKQAAANFDYAKVLVTAVTASPPTVTLQVETYNLVGQTSGYQVLGYGYYTPQDVKVTSDGKTAYITEAAGNLLKVDLTAANKNRSNAVVITTGLNNPQELQLDQAHHIGYTVENAAPGTLWAIDLVSGAKNPIISTLYYAAGLILDAAIANAYVSENPIGTSYWVVSKVNLVTATKVSYAPTFNSIYNLAWSDSTQANIIVTEPSYDSIFLLSISQSPATSSVVWEYPYLPESVAVIAPGQLLVVQDGQISLYSLSDPNFNYLGPTLLGIGYVPVTAISGGYATTSSSYFFYVQNSPFGGVLPLMVNYDKARSLGAFYYQIYYDGIIQTNPWNDYKWDPVQNIFVVTTTSADSLGRFPVRQLGPIWYNYWLGYFLDTTVYADNLYHTITVELFDTYGNYISAGTTSVTIFVDNNWPHAYIQTIYYTEANGTVVQVSACAIVQGTSDEFSFVIDGSDQIGQDLLSWSLVAYWGANQAATVASDTYSPNHSSAVKWLGPYYATEPNTPWHATVAGDPTSRDCAHTFVLGVWDRSINGWGYLHYSQYQVSLTILLS